MGFNSGFKGLNNWWQVQEETGGWKDKLIAKYKQKL